ncbi:MAG: helix-turn-helix domain-containing protein [Chloroflexi bacterium]|nr:helix-turn-helix domain-containing protein [Chloroflexota bacterium]
MFLRPVRRALQRARCSLQDLLTVQEAAEYLRVSRATIWRWCRTKKVRAIQIGREWRIVNADLLQIQEDTPAREAIPHITRPS